MLSIPHLIVLFIVALVVFGPEKLPELARNLGKVMAEFRRHTGELRSTFEGHLRDLEREADSRKIGGSTATTATTASSGAQPQPAAVTPGTVPADPPNAAAISGPPEPPAWEEPPDPDLRQRPYEPQSPGVGVESAFEPPAEPEKAPERVTDGDSRPV